MLENKISQVQEVRPKQKIMARQLVAMAMVALLLQVQYTTAYSTGGASSARAEGEIGSFPPPIPSDPLPPSLQPPFPPLPLVQAPPRRHPPLAAPPLYYVPPHYRILLLVRAGLAA